MVTVAEVFESMAWGPAPEAAEPAIAWLEQHGRFTRLTNAFSKKVQNLAAAVPLHFMYYNFGRVRQTLKKTPAMAAGVVDHVWTVEKIAGLLDESQLN